MTGPGPAADEGGPTWTLSPSELAHLAEIEAARIAEEQFEEHVRLLTLRAAGSPPPLGLVAARQLRELAEQLERDQIERARARGIGWAAMARLLGVSRQALHQWAMAEQRRRATPTEPGATP